MGNRLYTFDDFRTGKVLLKNDNDKITRLILKKIGFNFEADVRPCLDKWYYLPYPSVLYRGDSARELALIDLTLTSDGEIPTVLASKLLTGIWEPEFGERIYGVDDNICYTRYFICELKDGRYLTSREPISKNNQILKLTLEYWDIIKPWSNPIKNNKTEFTMDEIAEKMGVAVDDLKIIK
jgi:hypothetical protein